MEKLLFEDGERPERGPMRWAWNRFLGVVLAMSLVISVIWCEELIPAFGNEQTYWDIEGRAACADVVDVLASFPLYSSLSTGAPEFGDQRLWERVMGECPEDRRIDRHLVGRNVLAFRCDSLVNNSNTGTLNQYHLEVPPTHHHVESHRKLEESGASPRYLKIAHRP